MKYISLRLILIIFVVQFVGIHLSAQNERLLFQDPLNGENISGWKRPPTNFIQHPEYGLVYQIESGKRSEANYFHQNPPFVGDATWEAYRVEIEMLPLGGNWIGLDLHVQEDELRGFNVCIFTSDSTKAQWFEAMDFNGGLDGAWSWKLWPVSQKSITIEKNAWHKLRVDIDAYVANVYVNDFTEPIFTAYDVPYPKGGVRFFSLFDGKSFLRNLKMTSLSEEINPLLEDIWEEFRTLNIIRSWEITPPQSSEYGLKSIPQELYSDRMKWIKAEADDRGVVNVGALFSENNTKGTAFARTFIDSEENGIRRAWISYTDRCTLWCNGELVFKGPNRATHDQPMVRDCRIRPDQFAIELPVRKGENLILLRTEVTEIWGWGFWMRVE